MIYGLRNKKQVEEERPDNKVLEILEAYIKHYHAKEKPEKQAKMFEKMMKSHTIVSFIQFTIDKLSAENVRVSKPSNGKGEQNDEVKEFDTSGRLEKSGQDSSALNPVSRPSETDTMPVEKFPEMFEFMMKKVRDDERKRLVNKLIGALK